MFVWWCSTIRKVRKFPPYENKPAIRTVVSILMLCTLFILSNVVFLQRTTTLVCSLRSPSLLWALTRQGGCEGVGYLPVTCAREMFVTCMVFCQITYDSLILFCDLKLDRYNFESFLFPLPPPLTHTQWDLGEICWIRIDCGRSCISDKCGEEEDSRSQERCEGVEWAVCVWLPYMFKMCGLLVWVQSYLSR